MTNPTEALIDQLVAEAETHAKTILQLPRDQRPEAFELLRASYEKSLEEIGASKDEALKLAFDLVNDIREFVSDADIGGA